MQKIMWMVMAVLFLAIGSAQAHCGKCGVGEAAPAQMKDAKDSSAAKVDKLAKDLKLSDEQKVKVEALVKEKLEKKQKIMADKESAMDALHEDFKAKLKSALSEEQYKSWEAGLDKSGEMKGHCPYCKHGKLCPMCEKKLREVDEEK